MGDLVKEFTSRFTFRPLREFLDISAFKPPESLKVLDDRVRVNLSYYCANYAFIFAIMLLFVFYETPNLVIATIFLAAIGYYLFAVRNGNLSVGATQLNTTHLQTAYVAIFAFVLFYYGGRFLAYSLAFAALLTLIHAVLRNRSAKSQVSTAAHDLKSN